MYFWYKIIIYPHEATDSSVSSGACFYDYILKYGNEKVVCENYVCKAQTYLKRYEQIFIHKKTSVYFWYKIILHHGATDSSVCSGACFHDYI